MKLEHDTKDFFISNDQIDSNINRYNTVFHKYSVISFELLPDEFINFDAAMKSLKEADANKTRLTQEWIEELNRQGLFSSEKVLFVFTFVSLHIKRGVKVKVSRNNGMILVSVLDVKGQNSKERTSLN